MIDRTMTTHPRAAEPAGACFAQKDHINSIIVPPPKDSVAESMTRVSMALESNPSLLAL
jgi:hypothetical protein